MVMVTDPIADFITRINNANAVKKENVSIPYSQFKLAIATKLQESGYIKSVTKKGKKVQKLIDIELSYEKDGKPRISGLTRMSKPGKRMYEGASGLYPVKGGTGALILSTPKGVLTGKEARKEKVGGEVLFKIW